MRRLLGNVQKEEQQPTLPSVNKKKYKFVKFKGKFWKESDLHCRLNKLKL